MFPRFVVSFAVALGSLSAITAQAQLKILPPPTPNAAYTYTPSDVIIPKQSSSNSKYTANIPPITNTATLKVTGPKAKFEPDDNVVYHGASLPDTWSENGLARQIQQYNAAAGKSISVVTWFASAYEQGRMTNWRQNYSYSLQRVKGLKAASLIKFSTQDYAYEQTHKMADLKDIAAGTWDDYFKEAADTLRDFKYPVFLSINHEMNGNWYPYSQSYPGARTTAADYVSAWRRIVQVFRQEGATNVAFVWSPNVPDVGEVSYGSYYPGDGYVDWVGISLYSGNTMGAMDEIYRQFAPRKPFFITEWATAPQKNKYNTLFPGDVEWVRQFFAALETRYPRVKAISWFNWNKDDGDYRLTRVPEQTKAYSQDIANPRYLDKPKSDMIGSNEPQATMVDVVPNEPILRERIATTSDGLVVTKVVVPRVVVPPTIAPRTVMANPEKITKEKVATESVVVVR